ncbi:uncharacterized protein FSUBG_5926 [Fusarium subglutinans]|uniref:Uncharacterized protein n=1 Tax=Gibberella subglutinans TaxID=42677 RepID=A0A8H5V345_GIBSU|nr:uncharacterized protein FSUBG_5926 [Fusarium subglutinans]KAF5606529.1 hypothetical protein FSUBG_5926 [Fusarium subglutinans]
MAGESNAKHAIKSSSSGTANFEETSFSEQSKRDLRELFTMIARLKQRTMLFAPQLVSNLSPRDPKNKSKSSNLLSQKRNEAIPFLAD